MKSCRIYETIKEKKKFRDACKKGKNEKSRRFFSIFSRNSITVFHLLKDLHEFIHYNFGNGNRSTAYDVIVLIKEKISSTQERSALLPLFFDEKQYYFSTVKVVVTCCFILKEKLYKPR